MALAEIAARATAGSPWSPEKQILITFMFLGFGRTGDWFALKCYGVEPDILAFAKSITSGYLPLDGFMVSRPILDAMTSVPCGDRWIHAYTYSGHPNCCAVGLRNLEILEKDGLVENAAKMGARLLAGMSSLSDLKAVGEVRGKGLMVAVDLVADRHAKAGFDPVQRVIARVKAECESRGLFTRVVRDILLLALPLVINASEIDRIVEIVREGITTVLPERV